MAFAIWTILQWNQFNHPNVFRYSSPPLLLQFHEFTSCFNFILFVLSFSVLKCKSIFDRLEPDELRKARTRSNPFETIRGVIFLNRAAMKMANMDAVFDFMFTNPSKQTTHHCRVFQLVNACLRMHSHGRKQCQTLENYKRYFFHHTHKTHVSLTQEH